MAVKRDDIFIEILILCNSLSFESLEGENQQLLMINWEFLITWKIHFFLILQNSSSYFDKAFR